MTRTKKKSISIASRMTWRLMLLFAFTLSIVQTLGIVPDPAKAELRHKSLINETLAVSTSLFAQRVHDNVFEQFLAAIVMKNPDVMSVAVRRDNGAVLHQTVGHDQYWKLAAGEPSTAENTYVPITMGGTPWGTVELTFAPKQGFVATLQQYPLLLLGVFTVLVNGLFVRWYLQRAFNYLDPTKSVPMHVRSTLDTFSEGVVVLDDSHHIVLTNDKLRTALGKTDQELLGQNIADLPWETDASESDTDEADTVPWYDAPDSSEGVKLGFQVNEKRTTYHVNASAILGDDGKRRGTIATFDDITPLEERREELTRMLSEIKASRDDLTKHNEELQHLATRDPLTGCMNRRTFFEIFDKQWEAALRQKQPLSCFMIDVDHFKAVNDNHGHSMGDDVLKSVANALQKTARGADTVCRYGGEEFCVLLPAADTTQAVEAAQRMRIAIEELQFEKLSVTASIGVASINMGASDPSGMLEQADESLYAAKRNGRNQVVRWDDAPENSAGEEDTQRETTADPNAADDAESIPYPAVTSLHSALTFRDADTAAHCTRVAELCVATASGLLSVRDTYTLEVAALLHDIGKVGVPDSILLKAGPLTDEEWDVMTLHDRIGVEIIEASFSNQTLIDIMRYQHAKFIGRSDAVNFPKGTDIPVGARIIAIADAYDAMVTDRVYRKGRTAAEAFEELRRCAGEQFDPELVERFIEAVQGHTQMAAPTTSRQTSLQIGRQIERLAQAVDDADRPGIQALSARLEATAARGGNSEVQCIAAEIKNNTGADADLIAIHQSVEQLMTLVKAAQNDTPDAPIKSPSAAVKGD